jgi:phosphomevalonate kinase
VKATVPGKLMLAGEYATLRAGRPAVALAVARHLEVEVVPAAWSELTSPAIGLHRWPLREERATGDRVVDAAFSVAQAALRAAGAPPAAAHYVVRSQLGGGAAATKPGLGSSAAATVALVAAALSAHGAPPTDAAGRRRVRGLALLAHLRAQAFRGSGYDVAAIVAGGAVVVTADAGGGTPLAAAAHRAAEEGAAVAETAAALAAAQTVARHAWPESLAVGLVATGRGASTPALVERARGADPAELGVAAEAVAAALAAGAPGPLRAALEGAQAAFERWDEAHGLGLVTPALRELAAEARAAGLTPRIAGAGGGDSLVVVAEDAGALDERLAAWAADGWQATRVAVDPDGLVVSC